MRWAMGVEYDGSNYHGFQSQTHEKLSTIQETLEQAISRVAHHPITIITAGRTDAGVHATQQVIHFDTHAVREKVAWLQGINTYLPHDIAIKWVTLVNDDFHARFSAVSRHYQYLIFNSSIKSPLLHNRAVRIHPELNHDDMHTAAQYLVGTHDFSAFRAAQCQAKTAIRHIEFCRVSRANSFVIIDIKANAFLQHMVRNIAGVLIEIGLGKKEIPWVKQILDQKDRKHAGITAPPGGLYLTGVGYENHLSE